MRRGGYQLAWRKIVQNPARPEPGVDWVLESLQIHEREVATESEILVPHKKCSIVADDPANDRLVVQRQVHEKPGRALIDVKPAELRPKSNAQRLRRNRRERNDQHHTSPSSTTGEVVENRGAFAGGMGGVGSAAAWLGVGAVGWTVPMLVSA